MKGMFTCSKILRYRRVAWSSKSRTVHPTLQGTTTAVSPKVTVTFMVTVGTNVPEISLTTSANLRFSRSPEPEESPPGTHLSVETGATGVSGQAEITTESRLRL